VDETAFADLVEPHRRELRVHCYRMLGTFDEAEDLVQETFLRAWRKADDLRDPATVRAWLYRIATNACLDALDGRSRRALPHDVDPDAGEIAWLQPYPDPADVSISRETIELAFLAAIQHLPPRQRAALILRDVLEFPAAQTADLLDASVASTNSALQRARATLRDHLPEHRLDWAPAGPPSEADLAVLRRYMDAMERADLSAVAALLAADVRATMPPVREWFRDRDGVMAALTTSWDPASPHYVGRFRTVPLRANGRPAGAAYTRRPGEREFTAFAISVLRIEDGRIAEMTAFHDTSLFPIFGLPMSLAANDRHTG
jgi:RNA polymerase sigma-70 factor (ECF subfamily)